MSFAGRFSRNFASRFNFANVVFFLPAKVDLQVVRTRTYEARGDALSMVLRPADARPHLQRLATSTERAFGAPSRDIAPASGDGFTSSTAAAQRPILRSSYPLSPPVSRDA